MADTIPSHLKSSSDKDSDKEYTKLPFKFGGRSRKGVDCVGLALMWLVDHGHLTEADLETPENAAIPPGDHWQALNPSLRPEELKRGDLVFFRHIVSDDICHVAVALGGNQFLHAVKGLKSRIDRGVLLANRCGFNYAGAVRARQAKEVVRALKEGGLGEIPGIVLLIISVALSAASAFLAPRPKAGKLKNSVGRYSFDELVTRSSAKDPLPDILGAITVAGNSVYQSLIDKTQLVENPIRQAANRIVVLASGEIEDVDYDGSLIKVNGLPYDHTHFHPSGFKLDPAQTKAEAVTGTISSESNRPSISVYKGEPDITVPVDVRAQYDRNFPLYGFSGSAYLVFRLINSIKIPEFNVNVTVKGRKCRTFDSSGFVETTVTDESLAGADGSKVRFKLANDDIKEVTSITVNAIAHTLMSASNQTGNVFHLNKTKGFVEFITAPAASATILVTYKYYTREWTQNPASHLVYLLTEPVRGKGIPAGKIDWAAAVSFRDHCDELVTWLNDSGPSTQARYTCNYALDFRKPIQDHIRAVLDTGYAYLFVSNGKFVMKARKAEDSVIDFDQDNIILDKDGNSSFAAELVDRKDRANQIHLFYQSAGTLNSETEVIRDDVVDQFNREDRLGNRGIVSETLHMLGVDTKAQAERLAEIILKENTDSLWLVEFKTDIEGLALEPGDVITVTHSSQPDWNQKKFRIEDLSHDPDDRLKIKATEYSDSFYI